MVKFSDVQMRKLQLYNAEKRGKQNMQTAYSLNINTVHTFEIVLKG